MGASMTYALAFHDGERLYIGADTAQTRPGEPTVAVSTVGAAALVRDGMVCEESRVKFVRLTDKAVGTFSGNTRRAIRFLNAVPAELVGRSLADALSRAAANTGSFDSRPPDE